MSKKYALVIGNNRHDDSAWHDLKTPEHDAEAVATVLEDPKIGGFDQVTKLLNASTTQIRIAVAELFDPRAHRPDDLLLLYFSGHGELDSSSNLYFVGRETRRGPTMVRATGLRANYITDFMDSARSRRQVIILDCCYSGAFGKGAKGNVPIKEIFRGSGYGRHILSASEALQLSWEGDDTLGEVKNSFFTHFLIEGLRTGTADRNNDGYVDIDELYDHIYEGMMRTSGKQEPLKFSFSEKGDLIIARSPISSFQREQEQLTDVMVRAENAEDRGDYEQAMKLLEQVIAAEPEGLLKVTAQQMLNDVMEKQERAEAYDVVKRLAENSPRAAQAAWGAFTQQYPNYDPENLARKILPDEKSDRNWGKILLIVVIILVVLSGGALLQLYYVNNIVATPTTNLVDDGTPSPVPPFWMAEVAEGPTALRERPSHASNPVIMMNEGDKLKLNLVTSDRTWVQARSLQSNKSGWIVVDRLNLNISLDELLEVEKSFYR